jgi:peroxiredoxin
MDTETKVGIGQRLLKWARELVIFGLIFMGFTWYQTRNLLDRGTPLPVTTLLELDGGAFDLAQYKGKPTLLYFWAPWCSVCKSNAHNVSAVVGEGHHTASVALSYEDLGQVREFAEKYEMPRPVLLGGREESTKFNIEAFPTVYVLNPEGEVAFATMGYTTELGLRARLWAAGL